MRNLVFIAVVLFSCAAQAKETDKLVRTGPYLGAQPGQQDVAPNTKKVRARAGNRVLTWVGFQMVGQGGRVFIQSNEPPVYSVVQGQPNEVILEFPDTKLHSKNDGRKLETGWFPTAVAWVDAERQKGSVRVTVKLREVVGYDLRQQGNYLFLDFRPPTQPIQPPKLQTPTPE